MAREPKKEHDAPDLEARLRRLEEILARMESDEVALEEALRLFEEGVGHVREAEKVLSEAELRVEELLADGRTRPLEVDEE
ncbi:MAG TPA: exodeoxyribonuclease VII small subunit [Longimicrobiales bacterium]|nr:exodeoxyribonuclease VII small subunit [Longimicrobiales bacterium]